MSLQKYEVEFTILDLIPLPEDVPGGDRETLNEIISYCTYNNIPDIVNSEVHDVGYRPHHGLDTDHHDDDQEEIIKSETFVAIQFEAEEPAEDDQNPLDTLYVAAVKSLKLPEANVRHSYAQGQSPRVRHVIEICAYDRE